MREIALESLLLSDVAHAGLLTAFSHAFESRSAAPLLHDPMAEAIADSLAPMLARSPSKLQRRIARGAFRSDLAVHLALRARKFDRYASDFVRRHPDGCVVNLGCGLDTRFWRIDDGRLRLYDLDLPEMIALKRQLVEETERYQCIGMSVLDHGWIDRVAAEQPGPFIFLAEGLFMYLPAAEVKNLVLALEARFPASELVFETVNSTWLKPHVKWMVSLKMQQQLGLGRGIEYRFGISDDHEPESWSPGIRLIDAWCYLDEDEKKIGFIRRFRNWKLFRRTQWTVHYALGQQGPVAYDMAAHQRPAVVVACARG